MRLTIAFSEKTPLAPVVSVSDEDKVGHCKHPRWIQFFCLMAFRSLNQIDHGWVTLDDLTRLLAFKSAKNRSIAQFLGSTFLTQPLLMRHFIDYFVHFSPAGPYRLILPAEQIQTDLELLQKYLSLVFRTVTTIGVTIEEVFDAANRELSAFELDSSDIHFQQCIGKLQTAGKSIATFAPLVYTNLATSRYLAFDSNQKITFLLSQADRLASMIRDSKRRKLLQAYILDRRVWTAPLASYNSRRLMEMNQAVIELAGNLPKGLRDRAVLMAGRYYFKLYNSVRFGEIDDFQQTFILIRDLYHRAEDCEGMQVVPYDRDVFLVYEVQSTLVKVMKTNSIPEDDIIERYSGLIGNPNISQIGVLSIAEWITHAYLKANRLEHAFDFVSDALIEHSQLYQTTVYNRLKTLRAQLKLKTRIG